MASITLNNVSVEFPVYRKQGELLTKKVLQIAVGGKVQQQNQHYAVVKALDNVNLTLKRGDKVGLIGHNGAGKSTLLKTLAGIYEPTRGRIAINGSVSTMFGFGQGIQNDLTGLENIAIKCILMGMNKSEINKVTQDIADFAEIGDFLSMPLRTYSAGMRARLAFGLATAVKPEILLIDEVIGAGDAKFKDKAVARLAKLLDYSKLFVLASHSDAILKKFCNKILLIEKGEIKQFGSVSDMISV